MPKIYDHAMYLENSVKNNYKLVSLRIAILATSPIQMPEDIKSYFGSQHNLDNFIAHTIGLNWHLQLTLNFLTHTIAKKTLSPHEQYELKCITAADNAWEASDDTIQWLSQISINPTFHNWWDSINKIIENAFLQQKLENQYALEKNIHCILSLQEYIAKELFINGHLKSDSSYAINKVLHLKQINLEKMLFNEIVRWREDTNSYYQQKIDDISQKYMSILNDASQYLSHEIMESCNSDFSPSHQLFPELAII